MSRLSRIPSWPNRAVTPLGKQSARIDRSAHRPGRVVRGMMVAGIFLTSARLALAAGSFYVDRSDPLCSDTGPGSVVIPYCTISTAVAAQAGPGTAIYVKPGVYREQVNIPRSGLPGSPFLIQASAPGVTIDGADDFSSFELWNSVTGDVWLAPTVAWSVQQVFVDGTRLTPSFADPGFLPPLTFRYVFGLGLFVNAGGGSPGAHVTLVGHRPYGFRLNGRSWVTIDGFAVTHHEAKGFYLNNACDNSMIIHNVVNFANIYGIQAISCSNLLIGSNVVSDNNDHGIVLSYSTGCTIQDNESFRNIRLATRAANGVYLFGSPANVIQRNRWHDNQDTGQQIQAGSNNNISLQNRSWNNGDHGYDHLNANGTLHVGDVAYGNFKDGFSIEGNATGTNIYNCIAVDNGLTTNEFDLWVDSGSLTGFTSNYNIFWNSTNQTPVKYISTQYGSLSEYQLVSGQDAQSIQRDPRFVNPDVGDFHLTHDSPAIDSGNSSVPDWPSTDADGNGRVDDPRMQNIGAGPISYADRGALEYGSGNQTNPPAVNAPASVVVNEKKTVTVKVTASDPDGDPIFSLSADLSELPAGNNARFTTNGSNTTGTLTWTPRVGEGRTIPYHVQFTAANGLSGLAITAIRVNHVDHAPVVTAPGKVRGTVNAPLTVNVTASDPDGDPITSLTANISNLPSGSGALFTTDPSNTSGTLSWTPVSGDKGHYKVTFTVVANSLSDHVTTNIRIDRALIAALQAGNDATADAEADVDDASTPAPLSLSAAYPNPSSASVSFALELPETAPATWTILDLQGRTLWSEAREFSAGRHTLSWNGVTLAGERVAPGLYFMRLETAGEIFERRFVFTLR